MSSIFPQLGKPVGASSTFTLTQMEKLQAHRYVLLNCEIVMPFVDEFRQYIRRSSRERRPSATDIEKRVNKEFVDWFQKRLLETGESPSRGKIYIETHKRKNGSFVNDEARAVVEQIELNMTQSNINECEVSPNDAVGKVLGPEHSGRVRCMGMGAAPTNTFRNVRSRLSDMSLSSSNTATCSSTFAHLQHKVTRLETQLQGTLNALKTYMITKEGRIPEEFASLFDSQLEPSDAGSELTTPLDARRSSYDSNMNHGPNVDGV